MTDTKPETCLLKREDAEALALNYRRYGEEPPQKSDPLKNIPYSLLSAEHIRDYVKETGLIAPFYIDGGRKSRLKDAAYEGRIGTVAYQYMPGESLPKIIFTLADTFLKVPKNSIVFVECDLDFRLPEFIALRFNLQIKHVHRGLLLGTGPLIDPGYWGKLCIPLHNLTNEDYYIEKTDGLIWLEFTKTTSSLTPMDKRIGRPPLGNPFWEIREFLEKATRPINAYQERTGIHSAIPSVYDGAIAAAKMAQEEARKARQHAQKSSRKSEITFWGSLIGGGFAAGAVLLAMWQLTQSYYSDMSVQLSDVIPKLTLLKTQVESARNDINGAIQSSDTSNGHIEKMLISFEEANIKFDDLENRIQKILSEMDALKQSLPSDKVAPSSGSDSIAK